MTPRWIHLGVIALGMAPGCKPLEETQAPGPPVAVGPTEPAPADPGVGGAPGPAPAVSPGAAAPDRPLPKVQDRDPEEEKRKMAASRQRSGEARRFLLQRRYDEAVLHARQALKIHELNADAMLVLAEIYYKQGNYELTQTVAASVLGIDPKVLPPAEASRAHNLRGFALTQMGLPMAATQSFRKAAESDANNAAAWNNLGTRYLEGGDVKTAIDVFTYAVELSPTFYRAQLNLGAAYRAARRWPDAEQALQKALRLKPKYPEAYFNLGVLYLDADPYPGLETVARLNKAIGYLTQYRELAAGTVASGPPKRPAAVGRKQAPETVSPAVAEAYIAVAKKGLEREARKSEREQKRKEREPTKGTPGAEESAELGTPAPGTSPQAPAGGSAPSQPAPASPAPAPPPAGAGPPSQSPAPQQPAPKPQQPAPPSPQKPSAPAPQKPTPQKPGETPAPAAPAPQKPKIQRPGGS